MDRMLEKIRSGELILGSSTVEAHPMMMGSIGRAGYASFTINMMYGTTDWRDAHYMILASRAAGVTPILHIASFPWAGEKDAVDMRLVADGARGLALGAAGLIASVRSASQVRVL